MDELILLAGYLFVGLASVLVISPRVHLGFLVTTGLSVMVLGVLGLVLQYHELDGPPSFGTSGQWLAIKIGAAIVAVGLALRLMMHAHASSAARAADEMTSMHEGDLQ
jgi:hypothetical protein